MYYNVQISSHKYVFTYSYDGEIELGSYCLVNFRNKETRAIVVEKSNKAKFDYEIKPIIKVLEEKLDLNLFKLIKFVHEYYLEPYGSLIKLIEVNHVLPKREKKIQKKYDKAVTYTLSYEQQKVADDIINSKDLVHLLKGVTGSGKTQVYIEIMKKAISEDKSCILLLPEISLTPQLVSKLESVFLDKIAIWHSKLSENDKAYFYNQLKNGEKKILLGTRSAIFQPLKNLAYIIIDEEHEQAYKQESSPRYHVKNVAIKRAMIEKCKVILGSATPSFDTYYQMKQGYIKYHELKTRYNGAKLPDYMIVDLNNESSYLSDILLQKIYETIKNNEQVMLLLNRKSYSIVIKCRECKKALECKNCSYKLTYSMKKNELKCNQCEKIYEYTDKCFHCGKENTLEKLGFGTEKIEEKLKELFDENRILRMDSDTMNTKSKIERAYKKFLNKEYDIIIGTQIVAKGFHFPDLTLVGIINSDQLQNLPDYKVLERTYQLITQASGRAGREDKKGLVIIQSFNPESIVLKAIINDDYEMIYEDQMSYRNILKYPPYEKNIKILLTSSSEKKLENETNKIYDIIYRELCKISRVYPVVEAAIYKINKNYRKIINIIYERENEKKVKRILKSILENHKTSIKILMDVDPINML